MFTNAAKYDGSLAEELTSNCDLCGEGAIAVEHTVLLRIWWLMLFDYNSILEYCLQIHHWKQLEME